MLTKHEDDEDRRRVLKHGEKLRVDMMLMDSVAVAAATSGSVADELCREMLHNDVMHAEIRARTAWENRQRQIRDAWRNPPQFGAKPTHAASQAFTVDANITDAKERAETAREIRRAIIGNAWRASK